MSNANRGRKRQAPTESSNHSETNDNLSADDGLSVPGTATYDGTLSQISGGKRRRKRFTPKRRTEVAKVRKIGACVDCRTRKVRCPHALQGTDVHLNSAPGPKPSQQTWPFEFEATYPDIIYPGTKYPGTILEDDAGQWRQSDEAQFQNSSFDDGSHLIATVPALTARRDRLADELHDFENVIEDHSTHSPVNRVSSQPKWGQNSSWMITATALVDSQQNSQPSTPYLYSTTDISTDIGPSSYAPALSHVDSLSLHTKNYGYCCCNEYGCDRPHRATQDVHQRQYQEYLHVDVQPRTITFSCPVGCGVRPFRKAEYLHNHIKCNHTELLPSPTQLPPSSVSERDAQPDRSAQVQHFLDGEYLPGMEDSAIAISDHGTYEEIHTLHLPKWRRAASCRDGSYGRVLREAGMRRSSSPMQGQTSIKNVGDATQKLPKQASNFSSNYGIDFVAGNSETSFQRPTPRGRHNMDHMNNSVQSHLHHTTSPAPSLSGQFAHQMQISDQSRVFQTSSESRDDVSSPVIHGGKLARSNTLQVDNSATFDVDWDHESERMMAFNTQILYPHDHLGGTRPEDLFQPDYHGSEMSAPAWAGQAPSTSTPQTDVFSSGYAPLGFQSDISTLHYLAHDAASVNFPSAAGAAKQPMIMLNDGTMLHDGPDADFVFAPDRPGSDPVLSQRLSLPNLDYSAMSSSGASDGLVSPVDTRNPFAEKHGEEWDGASLVYALNPDGNDYEC